MAAINSDSGSNTSPAKDAALVDASVVIPVAQDSHDITRSNYRAEFLSSFTPEEEKKIMRKVDYRLLLLCGVIYMVKQVGDSR